MTLATITDIMIIDDDVTLGKSLKAAFERRALRAHHLTSGEEALEFLAQNYISHIVLDLKMRGENGLIILEKILSKNSAAQIVVLTGFASIATAVEAIKLGAVHYLAKPANADQILDAFQNSQAKSTITIDGNGPNLKTLEWERIHQVMRDTNFNISETARRLGMHRRTLARKLAKKPLK